jgi:hypothetical protein
MQQHYCNCCDQAPLLALPATPLQSTLLLHRLFRCAFSTLARPHSRSPRLSLPCRYPLKDTHVRSLFLVQHILIALVDSAFEDASDQLTAGLAAIDSKSASPAVHAKGGRRTAAEVLDSGSTLPDLIVLARKLHLQSDSSSTDVPTSEAPLMHGFPASHFFLFPFAAVLSPAEIQQTLTLILKNGTPGALQSFLARLVRSPFVHARIAAVDLGVFLINQSDVIMARQDRKALAKVATDMMFEDSANRADVFTSVVVTEIFSVLVNGAIARAQLLQLRPVLPAAASANAAPPAVDSGGSSPGPVLSEFFMRALLHCQKSHPELRGKLRGLLSALLLRAGPAALESIGQVKAWAAAGGGAAALTAPDPIKSEPRAVDAVKSEPLKEAGASVPVAPVAALPPPIWIAFLLFVKADVPYALELLTHLPNGFLAVLLTGSPRDAVLRDRFRTWFGTWSDRAKAPAHVHDLIKSLAPAPVTAPPGGAS